MNFPDLRPGISTIINACPGIDFITDSTNFNFSLIKDSLSGGYKWTVSKLSHQSICELKDKKIEINIPSLETLIERGKETVISDLSNHVVTLETASHQSYPLGINCINLNYTEIAKTMLIVFLNQYYILKAKIIQPSVTSQIEERTSENKELNP